MAAIVKLHKVSQTIGSVLTEYFVLLRPGIYTGDIATQTGVSEASGTELDTPATSVANLLGKGIVFRIICYSTLGTGATAKRRAHRLLVVRSKLGTALDGLKGKSVGGTTIDSVTMPRKKVFF